MHSDYLEETHPILRSPYSSPTSITFIRTPSHNKLDAANPRDRCLPAVAEGAAQGTEEVDTEAVDTDASGNKGPSVKRCKHRGPCVVMARDSLQGGKNKHPRTP